MFTLNLFKPKCLSIDLGTVNTLIYLNGELVLDEPSVVAFNARAASAVEIPASDAIVSINFDLFIFFLKF